MRGHQTLLPLTATYRFNQMEFGVRTAWVESVNSTAGRRGNVSTMTDTAFSFAYNQALTRGWALRYNLDYNAPTGKATLSGSEKNAIMDGNLVSQTRFGEGHNVTPGIVLTKAFTPNAAAGLGLSHTVRGSYDPNGDVDNDHLDPGDETRITLQGQYADENLMLIGGLIYTNSATSEVNNRDYFQKGDRYDMNLTGIFALPHAQRITLGARYSTQTPDTYANSITGNFEKESRNINGDSIYLTAEYAKTWQGRHTGKILADWLKIDANSYDQFNDLYNAGREKWQAGVGYEYAISSKSRVSATAKYFEMNDKATPATLVDTRYSGYGATVNFVFSY